MDASPAVIAASSPVELEIVRLRTLQKAGRHGEALAGAQTLLESFPDRKSVV